MIFHRAIVVTIVGAASVACLAAGQPARAIDGDKLSASTSTGAFDMDPYSSGNEASQIVQQWVDTNKYSAFNHMKFNDAYDEISVYLKGSPPAALANLTMPPGIRLKFVSVPYGLDELLAEGVRIKGALKGTDFELSSIGLNDQGDSLDISFVSRVNPSSGYRLLTVAESQMISGSAGRTPPLRVVPRVQTVNLARDSDTPPFYGGNLIHQEALPKYCTGGFSVFYGSAPNRTYGLVTADHCMHKFFYSGAGVNDSRHLVGRTHSSSVQTDSQMLIEGEGGGNAGSGYSARIFRGVWNSSSSRLVRNAGNPALASVICLSGAFSAELCGLKVVAVGQNYDEAVNEFLIRQLSSNPRCSGQNGDSGGPLYDINTDDDTVTIRGLEHAGVKYTEVSCSQTNPNLPYDPYGYRDTVGVAVSTITAQLGVAVATASNGG